LKIIFIVVKGLPGKGGIEKYTYELGSRLVKRGHEIIVYSTKEMPELPNDIEGMKIKYVSTVKKNSLEKMVASLMATMMQVFTTNVDVVHHHAFGPSAFCFITRLMGRKVVVQGHGLEWKRSKWSAWGKFVLKITERPSVLFPNALTAVSHVQQRYLKNKYNKDCIVIPTGVNQPHIREPNLIESEYDLHGDDYILFAARLVEEKGAHYLIEAYNQLDTDVKLVIAGDAKYAEVYKAHLMNLAAGNPNIIFPGFVQGALLGEFFSNAKLFVLPSEIEGLSTALLEAMSYGLCCLASDIEENKEALKDYGFYHKNMDVDSLAKCLVEMLDKPNEIEKKGELAKEFVLEHHIWDKITDDFEKLYADLCNT